jgi:cytochrome c
VPQWDFEHLNQFISGPQKYLNGTKMTFVGLKKPEDRINVLAYLHTKGGTIPFPAPNPALAASAEPPAPTAPTEGAAPGAAPAGEPTAVPAKPDTGAGGPAGQGPGAPAQVKTAPGGSSAASDTPPKH